MLPGYPKILIVWYSLSPSVTYNPLALPGYPKHRCRYSNCLTLPLPSVTLSPLTLPGYPKHTCWNLPLLTVSPLRYLKSPCVTWLPKTYMLIFAFTNILSAPLPKVPLRYLVTQNIDADILILWHCLSPPLPKIPLCYLVTQNIHADICLYWQCLFAPLPKVPLRYLVTQNIDANILIVWHCLSLPLPKVPSLPGYPKYTCWYLP